MIKHIVMWNVRGNTPADKLRGIEQLQRSFASLRGKIPGLIHLEIGVDVSRIDYACDVLLYSEFESQAALDAYGVHPEHLRVKRELADVRTARHQVDYVAHKIIDQRKMFPVKISQESLDQLFFKARTANGFLDTPVPLALLQEVYDIAKMGATSMNTQPTRYVFLNSPASRARLLPSLSPGNVEKTTSAPVTVIVATDTQFFEHMPDVWHGAGAREMFAGNAPLAQGTATRNGTLGGAYFMIAARSVGLDCGPMSGVDLAKVNAEFFPDGRLQANFLINLGYGDNNKLFDRNPRLSFEQACSVQ